MFGVDRAKLAQKSKKKRRWILALEFLLLLLGLGFYAFVYGFATHQGLERVLHRLVGDAPVDVQFADVNIVPWSKPFEPSTWKISIAGLDIRSKNPKSPDVHMARVTISVPDLFRAWAKRELAFHEIRATALDIHIKNQRPPHGFSAQKSALSSLHANRIVLSDAHVRLDPDPPLGLVEASGIAGTLEQFWYRPDTNELHAEGQLDATSFQNGHLRLTGISIDQITADGTDVAFSGGTFRVAGGRGTISGKVHDLATRPAANFRVHVEGARFEDLVRVPSKRRLPLEGKITTDLQLRAGGNLPRGKAVFSGKVTLDDARFTFGERVKAGTIDLIRSMPFTRFDEKNRLILPRLNGDVEFQRGHTDMSNVTFAAGKRTVALEAHVTPDNFAAFVHLVPEREKDEDRLLGLGIYNADGETRVKLQRKEMFQAHDSAKPSAAGTDHGEAEEPAASPRRKRLGLRIGRKHDSEEAKDGAESPSAGTEPADGSRSKLGWLRRKERRNEQNAAPPSREP